MTNWFAESGLSALAAAVEAAGGELRIVGGAVRDRLMGRAPKELDAACTLTPDIMTRVAQDAGFKVVPTGLAHGTVTVLLPERTLEVTSLRKDTACDGRHAEVVYTTDWQEDAARRDFTINALYMDRQGALYDYHDGARDIAARRLRFIGDAQQRIAEDGLRILRFYRFLATHGAAPADPAAMQACEAQRDMIERLSGERIAQEMRKLFSAADPLYSLEQMHHAGIDRLVLSVPFQLASLPLLMACEQRERLAPDWVVRALAIVDAAQASAVAEHLVLRWKLSNKEAQALRLLASAPLLMDEDMALTHKKYLRRHGRAAYLQLLLLSAANGLLSVLEPWIALADRWEAPVFPVRSKDVAARGYAGKALGAALASLERAWEDSDYTLDADALLGRLT